MLHAEDEEALLEHPARPKQQRRNGFPFPKFRTSITFVMAALFSGLLFYIIIFTAVFSIKPSLRSTSKEYIFGPDQPPELVHDTLVFTHTATAPIPTNYGEKPPSLNPNGLLELSAGELKEMVSQTQGYYVRDWSLGLGWNNMRYIIETAILHADLLNRTLVLPSFVYARACEYHINVCAKYATMVNRNDAVGSDEWRDKPLDQQMAWKIPLEVMIDIPNLRSKHKILTTAEFLTIQGLNIDMERSDGKWDGNTYHLNFEDPAGSLYVLKNNLYDPKDIVRVDRWDPKAYVKPDPSDPDMVAKLDEALAKACVFRDKLAISWADALATTQNAVGLVNNRHVEDAIRAAGWVILHTFEGDYNLDFTKSVAKPTRFIARYDTLHGWVTEYKSVPQPVLHLEGAVHLYRKPGSMYFTTTEARDNLAKIALYDVRMSERVVRLADKAIERLNGVNDGRTWMAAHARRGDFTTLGWVQASSIEEHLRRIRERLDNGRQQLEELQFKTPETYNIPDVVLNRELVTKPPPHEGDYIYLATDERDAENIQYLKENKVILLDDVVTIQDRREFGWPLLYTDVIALVEQQIMGHGAGYFYGHALSSVAGGVVNLRAASGCDKRTALLD